jgi:hypothetical protein
MVSEDPAYGKELDTWLRSENVGGVDGIPPASMGSGPYPVDGLSRRDHFAAAMHEPEALDEELARSTILVLFTARDDRLDRLRAGMALEHALLTATANDLVASFANQAVERPEIRAELGGVLSERGYPQLIIRVGRPLVSVPQTPRRPLEDLFA